MGRTGLDVLSRQRAEGIGVKHLEVETAGVVHLKSVATAGRSRKNEKFMKYAEFSGCILGPNPRARSPVDEHVQ